jgi:hypothetical protein
MEILPEPLNRTIRRYGFGQRHTLHKGEPPSRTRTGLHKELRNV